MVKAEEQLADESLSHMDIVSNYVVEKACAETFDDQWLSCAKEVVTLNPFLASVPILYPMKTPENQRFFGVFRRYKMGILARNGLTKYKSLNSFVRSENFLRWEEVNIEPFLLLE